MGCDTKKVCAHSPCARQLTDMTTTLAPVTHEDRIVISVLNNCQITGAERPFFRAHTTDLVVYLAFHRSGATTDQWSTALWPDRAMSPATVYSTASAARRALGTDSHGRDHLPARHLRLGVADSVVTDLDQIAQVLQRGSTEEQVLATEKISSRPFEGLRHGDWAVIEGHMATAEALVFDLVDQVVAHLLRSDQAALAVKATRKGLLACPYDERLWRLLLEATSLAGHAIAVDKVMDELAAVVGAPRLHERGLGCTLEDFVHPTTWELYRELTKHRPRARTTGARL